MNESDIELVLRATAPRDQPPEAIKLKAREHLLGVWHAIVAEESTRRQLRASLALAAGLVAVAIGTWLAGPLVIGPGEAAATVALASGELRAKSGWLGNWRVVGHGDTVSVGDTLMTSPSGLVAVTLPGGLSARLDSDTRIRIASADSMTIESGALYVDAGPTAADSAALKVVTPAGTVRHVGTQYEVRLLGPLVRVRVREGHIELSNDAGLAARGMAGEQLTIEPGGVVERYAIPRFGDSWDWVAAATPGIDIDGRSLADFLAWAGRELGHEIEYADAGIEADASQIVVHGSIAGLPPIQALRAVLATTHLQATVDDGRIVIGAQEAGLQPSVTSSNANPAT